MVVQILSDSGTSGADKDIFTFLISTNLSTKTARRITSYTVRMLTKVSVTEAASNAKKLASHER